MLALFLQALAAKLRESLVHTDSKREANDIHITDSLPASRACWGLLGLAVGRAPFRNRSRGGGEGGGEGQN